MRLHSAEKERSASSSARGFTLIEMIVVLAIISVVSAIILFNNSKFNSAVLLRSLAYEVGLSIREAQLYGVAVKEAQTGTSNFSASYGVHFNELSPTSYTLFADTAGDDSRYTPGNDTVVDAFTVQRGFFISDFCVTPQGSSQVCAAGDPTLSVLDISFRRPNPDAIILSSVCPSDTTPCTEAVVFVSSPGGSTRSISISSVGQISITGTGN